MSEKSDSEASHSTVSLGDVEQVNCPFDEDKIRFCPYCGEELR